MVNVELHAVLAAAPAADAMEIIAAKYVVAHCPCDLCVLDVLRREREGGTPAAGALPPRASSRSLLEEIGEHRIVFLVVVTVASALLIIAVGFRVGIFGGFAEIFGRVTIET